MVAHGPERLLKAKSGDTKKPPEKPFEEQMKESPLYTTLHLIDDAFLSKKRGRSSESFLKKLTAALTGSESAANLSTHLIELGVLSAADFQSQVRNDPGSIDTSVLVWMLLPGEWLKGILTMLAGKGVLTKQTLWSKFLKSGNFYNQACYVKGFDWNHLVNSGILIVDKINASSDGFDTVEVKALQSDLLGRSRKSQDYPLDRTAHSLVQRMRGQENTAKMSKQIEAVPGLGGSVMEDFNKVFEFYLQKTALYRTLLQRDRIPEQKRRAERAHNIKGVNDHQLKLLKADNPDYRPHRSFDPAKRHFDIYARYGHDRQGSMDPMQLAFISKAAEWYIMGGRSRLFNSVRVVPYAWAGEETIPYVALAACKGAELLPVSGSDFTGSIVGANRTFFTHSNSLDATRKHSIPIIGLATYRNTQKRSENKDDFVVFEADFDPKDGNRYGNVSPPSSRNVNGDIAGLINEALKTMVEVEDKEIARAEAAAKAEEQQQQFAEAA